MEANDKLELLDELFGIYKAEWLHQKIYEFFAAPSYFNDLKNARPCIIQGGRGSGKTTVLRGLSYLGQFALNGNSVEAFDRVKYIGVYYRANSNHVRIFQGKGIPEERWRDIFAHYYNLIVTTEILHFLKWHKKYSFNDEELSEYTCRMIATSLHVEEEIKDSDSLCMALDMALISFQSKLNNISVDNIPKLSLAGVPIGIITEQVLYLRQFQGKIFFLLVDEYENLLEGQQLVMNTLLKHTTDSYTFKIGVREMGWKVKTTLNEEEVLNDPADYVLFDIVDSFAITNESAKLFENFAQDVCRLRLSKLFENRDVPCMEEVLASMSIEDEALYWGVHKHEFVNEVIGYEKKTATELAIHPLYKFFLGFWAESHNCPLELVIEDYLNDKKAWDIRYDNYKYSLLFKIKKGRGSGGITKFYGGWSTFVKLANGNIRYLMELVYKSFYAYLQNNGDLSKPVPLMYQTKAAKMVGWKNLTELESQMESGAQLTRMIQSFGSIFGRLAKDGDRLAPEIVEFEVQGPLSERTRKLLSAGVMYLALVRMPANKLSSKADVREFMYMLHPIFAPYFNYSFRKKRKLPVTDAEFLQCIDNQKEGVAAVLGRKNIVLEEELFNPLQLNLFDFVDES